MKDRMEKHYVYCLMGKSGSGKDTIYARLAADPGLSLGHLVSCTTRPMREGEQNGREYNFYTEQEFHDMLARGAVIEHRCYQTVHGPWYYFTADDGQIDLTKRSTLVIGTLESYASYVKWFAGKDVVRPVYVEVEDGLRLQRSLDRERAQKVPRYQEMCRRFLSDSIDFSEDKLKEAGITRRFVNDDLEMCLTQIRDYILEGGEPARGMGTYGRALRSV